MSSLGLYQKQPTVPAMFAVLTLVRYPIDALADTECSS